ncbi:proclotting enzyme isoform X2 [Euwallacea fornicatus]|uniref:proclotting enzyme isoform X2 n=1 Tax=Euwallacea fornicatus TaxID=995702 RepID=UPI00338D48FA
MRSWITLVGRLLLLSCLCTTPTSQFRPFQLSPFDDPAPQSWLDKEPPQFRGHHFRRSTNDGHPNSDLETQRHFNPETIFKITETLGALNTVGRYLVNMTRSGEGAKVTQDVPNALYTISKNVLGRNVTDTIAPLVREALPLPAGEQHKIGEKVDDKIDDDGDDDGDDDDELGSKTCTTPEGLSGYCNDLSDCPQLLLNLSNLRQSLCFKSLFVPGVCCPKSASSEVAGASILTQIQSTTSTTTTTVTPPPATFASIYYNTETPGTTTKPVAPTLFPAPTTGPLILPLAPVVNNYVDAEQCGQPESAKFRVVGGEEALPGRWPWMAAIFLHGARRTEFWCGGSLISATHVLTAAHCTRDSRQRPFSARQFTVRLGDIDLKREDEPSAPVTFKVVEIRAHKQFSRVGFYNDIAMLKLDRPARKSKYVIPICLPPPDLRQEQFAGRRSTVVGWGTTFYGGKESTVQRQAILPIWRNEDCNQAYFQPITSNFICAGYSEGGTDACQGDSGGPLMLHWETKWIQVGVVSFGNKCGEPGYPGVYTRVTEYLDWIKGNIGP